MFLGGRNVPAVLSLTWTLSFSSSGRSMAAPAPSPFDSAWLWLSRVLSVVAWLAGLNYVVWRWRRVLQTSYWLR